MSYVLFAGLGNPGPSYAHTRHNAGFLVVDALAAHWNVDWREERRFGCAVARKVHPARGTTVWLAKPLRYMNCSGQTLGPWMRYQRLALEQTVVLYDEIQLPAGSLKISAKGSDGGHNGVADLLRHVGDSFTRLKLGVGPKPRDYDMKDFVLGAFSPAEWALFEKAIATGVRACTTLLDQGLLAAMNQFNRKSPTPLPELPEPTSPHHEPGNQKNL